MTIHRMRFFVYEFLTGGGWWHVAPGQLPDSGLFHEGSAMVQALAADLSQIGAVSILRDTRSALEISGVESHSVGSAAEEQNRFHELVRQADWTVLIAPEFAGHLLNRCRWVERFGSRLLSPDSAFVSIASDKHRTAGLFEGAGIRVPRGGLVSHHSLTEPDVPFPAIVKPIDGAGSSDVRRVMNWTEAKSLLRPGQNYRLEEFCAGLPASVSVLAGPKQSVILPASSQQLSEDHFQYLGGTTPLTGDLCRRASRLARQVVATMPPTNGYFGIDLILGTDATGADDVVIEVNPRLTTSYLGLRQITRGNLGEAMLRVTCGQEVELSFDDRPVQFFACNGLASTSAAHT
jgi:predicted ATP-grasp superfamily ATP-dependent carboligase